MNPINFLTLEGGLYLAWFLPYSHDCDTKGQMYKIGNVVHGLTNAIKFQKRKRLLVIKQNLILFSTLHSTPIKDSVAQKAMYHLYQKDQTVMAKTHKNVEIVG